MSEIDVRLTIVEIVDDLPIHREALGNLPEAPEGSDPFFALAAAFLVSYPPNTARAYTNDLNAWAAWCAEAGVHPLQARRRHVDNWIRHMTQQPQARTGKPAAAATVARRLSCLTKFYEYGIRDVKLLHYSPVATARRPKVSEDSLTIGLSAAELDNCSPPLRPRATRRRR